MLSSDRTASERAVTGVRAAAVIAGWAPRSLSGAAAAFAREVVTRAAPVTPGAGEGTVVRGRQAGRVRRVGSGLSSSRGWCSQRRRSSGSCWWAAPAVSPATRRTLRTNLRALARAIERYPQPAPVPLVRERAKAPYSPAEIDGYLRLARCAEHAGAADARERAGLPRRGRGGDRRGAAARPRQRRRLRARAGCWSAVGGARARSVPVLDRYHAATAGGRRVRRRAVHHRWPGPGSAQRHRHALRARCRPTARCRGCRPGGCARRGWWSAPERIGLGAFMQAAGISCSQRLGDLAAQLPAASETRAGRAARREQRVSAGA